nr:response regulator [Morganella morganii]
MISEPASSPPIIHATPAPVDVVHTGRYTLVSLIPEDALSFPLHQIASHNIPAPKKDQTITRGDALHTWLNGTGYGLCLPVTDNTRLLLNGPLPDVQRTMGPLHITDALHVIAGPAWSMTTDEITRGR